MNRLTHFFRSADEMNAQPRIALILGAFAAYALAYLPVRAQVGIAAGLLAIMPVGLAGWILGLRGGLLAGLVVTPLHTILMNLAGHPGWDVILHETDGLGTLATITVGVAAGYWSDLIRNLKRQIAERRKAEMELQETKNFLQQVVDTSPGMIFVVDGQGKLVFVNQYAAEYYETTPEQLIAKSTQDVHQREKEAAEFVGDDQEVVRTRRKIVKEELNTAPNGEEHWFHTVKVPLVRPDGTVEVLGISTNITERKQAEEEIRRRAETMTALYETTGDLVIERDLSKLLQIIVERAARLLNAPSGGLYFCEPELRQVRCVTSYNTPRDFTGTVLKYGEGAAGRVGQTGEPLIINDYSAWEGRARIFEDDKPFDAVLSVPMRWQDEVIGVIHVLDYAKERFFTEDDQKLVASFANQAAIAVQNARMYSLAQQELAERKAAEAALLESEQRFRSLSEAAFEGIMIHDQGIILNANQAFAELFGYGSPEDLIGKHGLDLLTLVPESQQLLRANLGSGSKEPFEITVIRPDGSMFPAETRGRDITLNGRKLRVVAMRDITERKQFEEALQKREDSLRKIVENMPVLITASIGDPPRDAIWNRENERLLGYRAEEILGSEGRSDEWLYPNPAYRARMLTELSQRRGDYRDWEWQMTAKNGAVKTVLWSSVSNQFPVPGWNSWSVGVDITERKQAEEQIKRQVEHLRALRTIDTTITASTDLHLSLKIILQHALAHLQVDAADVLLLNQHTGLLEYAAGLGFRTRGVERTALHLGEDYAGKVVMERKAMFIHDLQGADYPRKQNLSKEDFSFYCGVPLTAKGEVTGVIEVFNRTDLERDSEWKDFLEALAGQAALAVDDITLFENLQRSNSELGLAYETTLEGWSRAMDLRDKETEGHTQRVTTLTLKLARAMRLPENDMVHIRRGALLHDIGKIGVPDRILYKADRLTKKEWEIMRQHPVHAYNLLSQIKFLHPALDIPYCHHEKWDGTGYPRGLKGENIPLSARLFAVVDMYDALTSERPYRKRWSSKKSIEYIRKQSGSHFDPKIVDQFLKTLKTA